MGGCNGKSTTAKKAGAQPEQQPAPVLTEASAEEKALMQLRVIFESIDANKDGNVSKGELVAALEKDERLGALIKEAGMNQEYNALHKLETSTDGRVTWEEFQQVLKQQAVEEVKATGNVAAVELAADEKALQQLKLIFESLDANHDKAVSRDELAAGLQKDENLRNLVEEAGFNAQFCVLDQLDTNHDGKITWDEFEAHLRAAAKEEVKEEGDVIAAVVIEEEKQQELELQEENAAELDASAVAPNRFFCC